MLRILCEDIILVAAAAAADGGVDSAPGLTPSSNVTDFLCSAPCLIEEFSPDGSEDKTAGPRIKLTD